MLERKTGIQLNLPAAADCSEYSSNVNGEITDSIFEDGFSISAQGKRALGIARNGEIGMVKQIVGFHSEHSSRAFPQSEVLLQREIELCETGAPQHISAGITKPTRRWQRKGARIEPA